MASGIDLSAYFARVGYGGSTTATLATLQALVTAHTRSVPFENLDPLMSVPVADLGPEALMDKIVRRRRGGFCYEQNGLMGYVLAALGYDVVALGGRVVWMHADGPLPAETHQVLAVTIPGTTGPFLVDVGFGGQTLTSPIRLEAGLVQDTRHERFCIRHGDSGGYVLESEVRGTWLPLYTFTDRPQPRIDLEVGCWYVSTHPTSGFVLGLSAATVTDDARWNLRGRNLTVHRPDGHSERTRFEDAAQVLDALTTRFGINLDGLGGTGDLEARINEVLDA